MAAYIHPMHNYTLIKLKLFSPWQSYKKIYVILDQNERIHYMTDISKYKNVSLSKDTYTKIDKIRRVIQPNTMLSRSQTINILVNEKMEKLNGKAKNV